MKFWFQLAFAVLAVTSLIRTLYHDVNGRPALEPLGFRGVLATVIAWPAIMVCEYYAGFFSALVGAP